MFRKQVLLVALLLAGSFPTLSRAEFLRSVNEHPFTGYPGLTAQDQIEQTQALGGTSYWVNISSIDHTEALKALIAAGET